MPITHFEDMIDHHSFTHDLGSCEIKAWKKKKKKKSETFFS